jgi:hypothetical protein
MAWFAATRGCFGHIIIKHELIELLLKKGLGSQETSKQLKGLGIFSFF